MIVERISPVSGKLNRMIVPLTEYQLQLWQYGHDAQDVMYELNAAEREFVMTGITPNEMEQILLDCDD